MDHEDGFITRLSIKKGWPRVYTSVKVLWVAVAVACGFGMGLLSSVYAPELFIPACVVGIFIGLGLGYLCIYNLPNKPQHKSD